MNIPIKLHQARGQVGIWGLAAVSARSAPSPALSGFSAARGGICGAFVLNGYVGLLRGMRPPGL